MLEGYEFDFCLYLSIKDSSNAYHSRINIFKDIIFQKEEVFRGWESNFSLSLCIGYAYLIIDNKFFNSQGK